MDRVVPIDHTAEGINLYISFPLITVGGYDYMHLAIVVRDSTQDSTMAQSCHLIIKTLIWQADLVMIRMGYLPAVMETCGTFRTLCPQASSYGSYGE